MTQQFYTPDGENGLVIPDDLDIEAQIESLYGLSHADATTHLRVDIFSSPQAAQDENALESQLQTSYEDVILDNEEPPFHEVDPAVLSITTKDAMIYRDESFSHNLHSTLYKDIIIAPEAGQAFSSRAVAFVKTWIAESHGSLPTQADITWLAGGTGQRPVDIERIFGFILRGNEIQIMTSLNNSSIESLSNGAYGLHLQNLDTLSNEKDILTEASQWVALNPTSCRPQRDSRSSEDSSRKYQCTVGCNQRFARKDTWKEHEERVHPQKAWLCNIGLSVVEGNLRRCSFCGMQNPDMNHWQLRHSQQIPCEKKPFGRGTTIFYPRKLFISHLNNIHPGLSSARYLKEKSFDVPASFDEECDICHDYHFESWDMRVRHMSDHFLGEGTNISQGKNAIPNLASSSGSTSQVTAADILFIEPSEVYLDPTSWDADTCLTQLPTTINSEALLRQQKLVKAAFTSSKNSVHQPDTSASSEPAAPVQQKNANDENKSLKTRNITNTVKWYLHGLIPSSFRKKATTESDAELSRNCSESFRDADMSSDHTTSLDQAPRHYNFLGLQNIGLESRNAFSLKDELMEARIPTYDMRHFIPEDAISRITTAQAICQEIFKCSVQQATPEALQVLDIVIRNARKLFGILTILDRGDALESFLCEGITDLDLPFSISKHQSNGLALETSSGSTISTFSQWPRRDMSNFCRDQWCFLAPHFEEGMRHLELDDSAVLPFEEHTSDGLVEGGFSSVWGVRIHPSHCDFYEVKHGLPPRIAIKRLHSANRDRFERETHMLKQLAPKDHPHLIKLLGTYQYQHAYHLIFPFANENLRGYWQRVQKPWETPELTLWAFRQLRGIASGLETIHDFPMEDTAPDFLTIPKTSINKPQWGRHGDIKPENVLWFSDDRDDKSLTSDNGRLVLADFGLMEFHGVQTRSNVDPDSIGGTPTYEPPERRLRLPISRAFDIWSMGCTMLEFVTWLLEAWEGVDQFSKSRVYPIYEEFFIDAFYEILPSKEGLMYSSAVVNPRVVEWIQRLYKHERASPMICNLLDVIRDRLLVVNATGRMTSQELVSVLDSILSSAYDTKYSSIRVATLQESSRSRKSLLRYDSSTEDLRQNRYGKRNKLSN